MTYNQEQQTPKFIFGDKEYDLESLTPEQVAVIQSIKVAEQKLGAMQSEMLVMEKGRAALIEDLKQMLDQ